MEPAEPEGPSTTAVAVPADRLQVRYFEGLPPEMTGGVDVRRELPPAVLVLVMPYGDGRWDVDRYGGDGSYAGSTQHESWTDVLAQLGAEYESDQAFAPVPPEVNDVRTYASELAAQRTAE